jgi:hypothetical protein
MLARCNGNGILLIRSCDAGAEPANNHRRHDEQNRSR